MNCKMPVIWFETIMKSEIPDEELEDDDDNEPGISDKLDTLDKQKTKENIITDDEED